MVLIPVYLAYKGTTQSIIPNQSRCRTGITRATLNPEPGFSTFTRTKHGTQMSTPVPYLGCAHVPFTFPLPMFPGKLYSLPKKSSQLKPENWNVCWNQIVRQSESKCCICKDEHFPAELIPEAIFIQLTGWNKLLLGQRNLLSQSIWTLFPQLSVQEAGNVSSFSWKQ